jgi:hypothetical protein
LYIKTVVLNGKVNSPALAGVAQLSSHLPEEQKIQVRIPPWCKVFRENIAVLLCKLA